MRRVNIATALVFLVLSAVTAIGTRDLPYWADFAPGPGFVPVWLAAAGALLALVLLWQELRNPTEAPPDWPDRSGWLRVALTAAALCAALALAPALGFVATVAVLTLFILLVVERRRLLPSLAVTVLTTALVQVVFVTWLAVALPKGVLGL